MAGMHCFTGLYGLDSPTACSLSASKASSQSTRQAQEEHLCPSSSLTGRTSSVDQMTIKASDIQEIRLSATKSPKLHHLDSVKHND